MRIIQWLKTKSLVILIIAVSLFLEHFPDYYGYLKKPDFLWYSGQVSWFDPWDINDYISAVGVGRRGSLLFENVYDSTVSDKLPIYFVYTLTGKILSPFNLSHVLSFHLAGFFFGFLFMLSVWWFTGVFLKEKNERIIVFALLFLSGGLGWIFFPKIIIPDLGNPGFLMLSPLRRAHEAVSFAFLILSLGFFFRGVIQKRRGDLFLGGFFSFATICIHPHNLIILLASLTGMAFWQSLSSKKYDFWKTVLISLLAAAVFYLILGGKLLKNPSFAGLAGQIQHSANPLYFILGWGLLFPFILIGLLGKDISPDALFFKNWFVLHWLSLYLPIHFQKLFIRGLYVPSVFLAFYGLKKLSRRIKADLYLLAILLLIFSSVSVFYMFFLRIDEVDKKNNRWIYLTKEEGKLLEYLDQNGREGEGVLALYRIANMIPAHTNKKVYAGHTFQTPDFEKRIIEVEKFFRGEMTDTEKEEFLDKARISWIFFGPEEKALGSGKPLLYKNMFKAIEVGEAVLYQKNRH